MKNLCNVCPRNCNVDRTNKKGFCSSSETVLISKVMLHFFEEPLISGDENFDTLKNGSGTIFFANCTLKCCYCQNSEISSGGNGKEISITSLANIFKQLENSGANNINLVTPTHYTNQIIEALNIYKPTIPIVWNTSGYETIETISKLKNYVDVYLTDFKYFNEELSQKYSLAKNYPDSCKLAIIEMRKNQPVDIIQNGLIKKGVIVRHLVLPSHTKDSEKIIDWVYENLGNQTYFSLMAQYVPMANAKMFPEINRKITPLEYKILVNKLKTLGFKNALIQDLDSANTCYTPDFNSQNNNFKF